MMPANHCLQVDVFDVFDFGLDGHAVGQCAIAAGKDAGK